MSTFVTQTSALTAVAPDPTKHVLFQQGMVLGVDDFTQEFAYLAGRDQWLARDLLGYGTVTGLRVRVEDSTQGPRVVVEPGVALSPRGQLIRVPAAQCAHLNDWLRLAKTKQELADFPANGPLTIYVVLCYRDCATDPVPIPGEPCRSEDDQTKPGRLTDDFELRLSRTAPGQREEEGTRDFVQWLSQIAISEIAASIDLDEFLSKLRIAAHTLTSPPSPGSEPLPDYLFGSPPASLLINRDDLCAYLRAAFRLWVTELRPLWRANWFSAGRGCSGESAQPDVPPEECLLLAELRVPVITPSGGGERQVQALDLIEIIEDDRPYLLHLRMLQEWLLCGKHAGFSNLAATLMGDATGPLDATEVVGLRGNLIADAPPIAGQVLQFNGGQWSPSTLPSLLALPQPSTTPPTSEQSFGLPQVTGGSTLYSPADHSHGTPPDPIPAHVANVTAHLAHQIRGDVTGTLNSTRVSRLQGYRLELPPLPTPPTPINNGDVLTFRNNAWTNEAPQPGTVTDVVEHPPGLSRYLIVAAGTISGGQIAVGYNGLRVVESNDGLIVLTFDGYKEDWRDKGFQLIVKALPIFNRQLPIYYVTFGGFDSDHFTLVVTDRGGQPVARTLLGELVGIMVEVSAYEPRQE